MLETTIDPNDLPPLPSRRIKTRDLLEDLGFEPMVAQWTDQQPGYIYRCGSLDLQVSQVTSQYLRPEMQFTGTYLTPRTSGRVEFSLPMELESFEQGVALIAHNVGRQFIPVKNVPWLDLGRTLEDHLPGRRELQLFAKRPKCHIEAEWFRVAAKKLIAHGLAADETRQFNVSFVDHVVKFELGGETLVMPASGTAWTETYSCNVHGLRHLSKRTPSEGVDLGFWQGHFTIGKLRIAATKKES